ncbi:hypothetical protein B0H14DRAFT_2626000 [Mycena olivaceomarginata]|nr:hypothetical protein B0H14DRAFT_2626000 [Mycena olivaceomarginata]
MCLGDARLLQGNVEVRSLIGGFIVRGSPRETELRMVSGWVSKVPCLARALQQPTFEGGRAGYGMVWYGSEATTKRSRMGYGVVWDWEQSDHCTEWIQRGNGARDRVDAGQPMEPLKSGGLCHYGLQSAQISWISGVLRSLPYGSTEYPALGSLLKSIDSSPPLNNAQSPPGQAYNVFPVCAEQGCTPELESRRDPRYPMLQRWISKSCQKKRSQTPIGQRQNAVVQLLKMTKQAKKEHQRKSAGGGWGKEPDFANPANKNSWLWELRRPSNMSEAEMVKWESEGKYPYLLLNHKNSDLGPGFAEQAKGTVQMWKQLSGQCQTHLTMAGYKFVLEPDFNLVSYVKRERRNHDNVMG